VGERLRSGKGKKQSWKGFHRGKIDNFGDRRFRYNNQKALLRKALKKGSMSFGGRDMIFKNIWGAYSGVTELSTPTAGRLFTPFGGKGLGCPCIKRKYYSLKKSFLSHPPIRGGERRIREGKKNASASRKTTL